MIRPFTCCCLLLAAGAGLYTYQAKHQAELVDREIARVLRVADEARQRSGQLRAEYAMLNDPSRLTELATAHLPELRPTDPKQYVTLAELDRRLPPVGPPPTAAPALAEPAVAPPAIEPPPALVSSAPTAPSLVKVASISALAVKPAAIPPVPIGAAVAQASWAAPKPAPAATRRPPVQKLAAIRPPRPDAFATQVSAPAEALARLAASPMMQGTAMQGQAMQGQAMQGLGVGRSGLGGSTFSSLGMARTASALVPPPR